MHPEWTTSGQLGHFGVQMPNLRSDFITVLRRIYLSPAKSSTFVRKGPETQTKCCKKLHEAAGIRAVCEGQKGRDETGSPHPPRMTCFPVMSLRRTHQHTWLFALHPDLPKRQMPAASVSRVCGVASETHRGSQYLRGVTPPTTAHTHSNIHWDFSTFFNEGAISWTNVSTSLFTSRQTLGSWINRCTLVPPVL